MASFGITGITDATPELTSDGLEILTGGQIDQRLMFLGTEAEAVPRGALVGPHKIVVADHSPPTYDELFRLIRSSRPRPVAIHSVTRVTLLLALTVLADIGPTPGDRIEHAAVVPCEAIEAISKLGLAIVTQPSFIRRRGDEYLDRVSEVDQAHLWPFRSLLNAGVPVGCGSDAPYGDLDPWSSVRAAVDRRALSGRVVVESERVSATQALNAFLSDPASPGGAVRRLKPGDSADVVLLNCPLQHMLSDPSPSRIRLTLIAGRIAYRGSDDSSDRGATLESRAM
jgi:predicted amidohydrolase YtcJ